MIKEKNRKKLKTAVFGGGCFWCLEAAFAKLKGVKKVVSGYAGGNLSSEEKMPTYEEVCSGKTGHAEVIRVEYDPEVISFEDLLTVFFVLHDPTTVNRQGADVGTQYRSLILYFEESQKSEAKNFIKKLTEGKAYDRPLVTEIKPLERFFPAEGFHQHFFENNPYKPYCQLMIIPKIEKLQRRFKELLK
jgi:peptide-methionine (S)-S-oxide reductase